MATTTTATSPELRERKPAKEDEANTATQQQDKKDDYHFASRFKKFIILVGIWFAMVMAVSYGKNYLFGKSSNNADDELFGKHFNSNYIELEVSELAQFTGQDASKPILLAIQGRLYDVTRGRAYYGPNGGYHIFAGRDASRSFVTGCFDVNDEKCTKNAHDISDFDEAQRNTVKEWMDFYEKNYRHVGSLINSK